MPAAENSEACIACGEAPACLLVIGGRRGDYHLCGICADFPRVDAPQQKIEKVKKAGRARK